MSSRWAENQSKMARRFILGSLLQAGVSIGLTLLLAVINEPPEQTDRPELPAAFMWGTVFLAVGSWYLHGALHQVRRERQRGFRRMLVLALLAAVLFVGIQAYGLWGFVNATKDYRNTQLNSHGFVFMFVALHAMHFLLAQSVLLWVTLAAFHDRYDHEYYFGVAVAAWFWHLLGIVWVAILCVFYIVS